jgi:prophage regulatory protein
MRILRISEVAHVTGLSPSSIYKQIRLGEFPAGIKLTARATGWSNEAVDLWVSGKLESPESSTYRERK